MGYESKVFIVNQIRADWKKTGIYNEVLCEMNLCCMGDANGKHFREVFTEKCGTVGIELPSENSDTEHSEHTDDKYGATLKCASIDSVIDWLECHKRNKEYYRRAEILLQTLRAYRDNDFPNAKVIHFGY